MTTKLTREQLDARLWRVVGGQNMGDKALWLRRYSLEAVQSGFSMSRRTVAAMEAFKSPERWEIAKGLLEEGLPIEHVTNAIDSGSGDYIYGRDPSRLIAQTRLTDNEERIIFEVMKRYGKNIPLAVRSSAFGDASGNGNYSSAFVWARTEEERRKYFRLACIEVLLSQFKPAALAYRRDFSLPEGIAIMVEPVAGIRWKGKHEKERTYFGPEYGGYAISGTMDFGAFSIIWPGLPTKAVEMHGIRISPNDYEELFGMTFDNWRKTEKAKSRFGNVSGELLNLNELMIIDCTVGVMDTRHISEKIGDMPTEWLFQRLEMLARAIGKRLYIEFGAVANHNGPLSFLLQLAEYKQSKDANFSDLGVVLANGTYVENGGEKACKGIMLVKNGGGIEVLKTANVRHSEYLLVLSTNALRNARIPYDEVNGANVILESGCDDNHGGLGGHFTGTPRERGVVLAGGGGIIEQLEQQLGEPAFKVADLFSRYDAKVCVRASVKEQRVTIEQVDD
ncbi:MAG: hypothetical protein WCT31_01485 [Candidatus Micrarchaeia archaeon]